MPARRVLLAPFIGARSLAIRLLAVFMLAFPATAHAGASCYITSSPTLNFGTVNLLSGGPYWASGTSTFTCTGIGTATTIYFCHGIGAGNGYGSTTSVRTISSSTNKANIKLYVNAAGGTEIGNVASTMAGPYTLSLGANYSNVSTTVPTAVELLTPQTVPNNTYTANFPNGDDAFYYTQSSASTCSGVLSSQYTSTNGDLVVTAVIPGTCAVTTTSLSFGTLYFLNAQATAQATVGVTCTSSTSVTVSLDNGLYGGSPTARKMVSGSNSITYGIYQDSGGTTAWGNSGNTVTKTVGTTQVNITAYGVVPIQTTPPLGSYADTVYVTISY